MMERVSLGHSTKNIPLRNERNYKVHLFDKIEVVIKRIRWKEIFFEQKSERDN